MQGTPGLAGRIFTAISRENINIIAIAQGSSELTIVIVVARPGMEKAVHAVHEECGLGQNAQAAWRGRTDVNVRVPSVPGGLQFAGRILRDGAHASVNIRTLMFVFLGLMVIVSSAAVEASICV